MRSTIRSLRSTPGFTLAAVLTLAVGIGAFTTVYGVVDAMVLRPLPFGDRSPRLVTLHSTHPTQATDWDDSDLSYADLIDLSESGRAFDRVEGILGRNIALASDRDSERVLGASVTPGLFAMLGVAPAIGRDFRPEAAAEPGFETEVIISDALWHRLFAGDPSVTAKTLLINGRAVAVVGVMPPRFSFPEGQQVWLPLKSDRTANRARRQLLGVGLMREGVTVEQATSDADRVARQLAERFPDTNRDWRVVAMPMRQFFVSGSGASTILAAVGLLLAVACANVAGLIVTRSLRRRQELTVRAALGASRARLITLLLSETLALSVLGGALGILLAMWGIAAIVWINPEPPPYWATPELDLRVALIAIMTTALTAIASGLVPALRFSRAHPANALGSGTRNVGGAPSTRRAQRLLVVAQVAVSLSLLVGATLLGRSSMQLQSADAGFPLAPLLSLRFYIAGDAYDAPAAKAMAVARVLDQVRAIPGVSAVGATGSIPSDDGGAGVRVSLPGQSAGGRGELGAQMIPASATLWDALGLRLQQGRAFTDTESRAADADVAIVNTRLAERFWPKQDALGRTFSLVTNDGTQTMRVVGVAPDLVYEEFGETTEQSQLNVYVPIARANWRTVALLVRASADPAALAAPARQSVRAVDPTFAVYDMLTMEDRRAFTHWGETFMGETYTGFAIAALLLAGLGVWGTTSQSVAERTREIGLRLAIGAAPRNVVSMFVRQGIGLGVLGVAAGFPLAVAMAASLSAGLFNVSAWDARMWLALPTALMVVMLLATWLPARRASRVEPASALR